MPPAATTLHLPNGQTLSVSPVFGGLSFKSNQLDVHNSAFPPGWTIIIQTDDELEEDDKRDNRRSRALADSARDQEHHAHKFTKPTLQNDWLFFSSISMPSSSDFKPISSPTRQTAMMLWATLWWYFHQREPCPHVSTEASAATPESGRPKADWRIRIKREGIFKGKNLLQKLERMGLIVGEDSSVGVDTDLRNPTGWSDMFVCRKAFWQIDPRIFLFSLSPNSHSPLPGNASPYPSRPGSPARNTGRESPRPDVGATQQQLEGLSAGLASPGGPFASGSHLPTYYPPPPPQYIFTNHIRHPIRQKPPRQGETFYTRFIPSVDQYLSFRIPSLSVKPPPQFSHLGGNAPSVLPQHPGAAAAMTFPALASFKSRSSDIETMNKWMNEPRVNAAWGVAGPVGTQQKFLEDGLSSRHSFPVIGCWDGKPFGYFEIYWVKEDRLGRLLGGNIDDWTRGLHVLIGEQEFRGAHRVKIWLTALVHYCFLADPRTQTVMLEPRVDNEKFIAYLQDAGFHKDGEVTFPHKQSAVMKIRRDVFESPAL